MADEQVRKLTLITNNHEKIEQNYDKVEIIEFYLKDYKELAKLLGINKFSALKLQAIILDHMGFCERRKKIQDEFLTEDKK